jgi:proteasome lid subunit RPN8/RPN11
VIIVDTEIILNTKALAKILDYDRLYPDRETAGILIGKVHDTHIEVTDMESGGQKGNAAHVQIDDQTLIDIVNKVTSKGDDSSIIGWWHSHPNIGAHIFSSTDINTQNAYQALFERAIAFVIDQEKFKRTANFTDLDTRFYRVDGSKSYAIPYELRGDPANEIHLFLAQDDPTTYVDEKTLIIVPTINRTTLNRLKKQLNSPSLNRILDESEIVTLKHLTELHSSIETASPGPGTLEQSEQVDQIDKLLTNLHYRLKEFEFQDYTKMSNFLLSASIAFFGILSMMLLFYSF